MVKVLPVIFRDPFYVVSKQLSEALKLQTPRGAFKTKNITNCGKKGGGSEFFTFCPNSNNRNMALIFMIYGTDIGEIYATFGSYMAYI